MQQLKQQLKTQQQELLFKVENKYLIDICKNLKELIIECRMQINRNGLRITEIDPSNICMIDVVLNNSVFYELTDDTDIKSYGINIDNLYNIIKDLKKDSVRITTDNNKLFLSFDSGFKSEISLIEIETEKKEIPIMDFNTEIKINAKRFKEIMDIMISNTFLGNLINLNYIMEILIKRRL